ncbi:hypothetical protein NGB36_05270 [Streptomyces sp. RB6PN25]|uniref:Haemophore haem-binding domain-containing protein n=1 Tax=Streptomyces humicola TaxID=2953240 RepID=A0ABT1PU19_9ACTN|nr:hypothetical protein [Streptomyces humicola]MCQ4080017.1 hypothetical protein [Streptomyces humicola]
MKRRKAMAAATVAGLALTGSLVASEPSFAAGSTSASTTVQAAGPKTDGARALCRRVPRIERRLARAVTRIDAGVGTPGSIKYLEQRIQNAKNEGHTAIAKFLGDRLTAREALLPTLEQRQSDIKTVASWCAANNDGKTADASS